MITMSPPARKCLKANTISVFDVGHDGDSQLGMIRGLKSFPNTRAGKKAAFRLFGKILEKRLKHSKSLFTNNKPSKASRRAIIDAASLDGFQVYGEPPWKNPGEWAVFVLEKRKARHCPCCKQRIKP